jgi:phenylalanyl-tRNA synthetase beta chain
MKFTLGWLKDHLDTNATLDEIAVALTSLGLEVESIEDRAAIYAPFKVVTVLSAEKHPDADRLRVCQVDTGSEILQVVCGAPNARAGMRAVFAPAGSVIPSNGMVMKKGNIRGQESNGMMVSEREMGLSDEGEGIIDLPADTLIGTPLSQIYGLDDPLIEIAVTPDRVDCAGVRGIARDLAAFGLGTLKPLRNDEKPESRFESPIKVNLDFEASDKSACPLFIGRYIKGVKNIESPEWLQMRLKAVGLRPISALVDITNYFTIDLCRPLHVFDADKINGNIHARLANNGEDFKSLFEKDYKLQDFMTVITDDTHILGVGGVVGGLDSGCTDDTKNVFLEVAYFDPARIAKTGRALQIDSDARYRFERGIDAAFTEQAAELATQMIIDICGGEASYVVKAGEVPAWKRPIQFDTDLTEQLSGVSIDDAKQYAILKSLGFTVEGATITPPSWRNDVEGKADLVEEVIRINGYDKIPTLSLPKNSTITMNAETMNGSRSRQTRTVLADRGMHEAVTFSFMAHEQAALFSNQNNDSLKLLNPISADLDQMRPSALPNLVLAGGRNAARGFADVALFEVGPAFTNVSVKGGATVAAGVRMGKVGPRHWSSPETARATDLYDVKADVIAVLNACGLSEASMQITRETPSWYHPGRSGAFKIGNRVAAYFGELHPQILESLDIKQNTMGFEVFFDVLPPVKRKSAAKPLLVLSNLQPVNRDFAFLVADEVEVDLISRTIKNVDKKLISSVNVFDIYKGKGVEDGMKSVALTVTYQPVEQTLTDSDLELLSKSITKAVLDKTGGQIRS